MQMVLTLLANIGRLKKMPEELIKTVYPNITTNANAWLVEQAILAPLNNMANSINGDMVHEFKRKIMKCTSIESVISED